MVFCNMVCAHLYILFQQICQTRNPKITKYFREIFQLHQVYDVYSALESGYILYQPYSIHSRYNKFVDNIIDKRATQI